MLVIDNGNGQVVLNSVKYTEAQGPGFDLSRRNDECRCTASTSFGKERWHIPLVGLMTYPTPDFFADGVFMVRMRKMLYLLGGKTLQLERW